MVNNHNDRLRHPAYLATLAAIREAEALKQYRWHRQRCHSIEEDTCRFLETLYARAEWNALRRLVMAQEVRDAA